MPRFTIIKKVLNIIYLPLFAYFGLRLYSESKQYGLSNYYRALSLQENDPFITFIVPSLQLSNLATTLKSITTQTEPNWEAIVGFDFQVLSKEASMHSFKNFYRIKSSFAAGTSSLPANEDSRITPKLILRVDDDDHNAAGGIRNRLMKFARGEWITFVKNEDTLSPCFTEWLERGIQKVSDESGEDNEPDLVLFQMKKEGVGILSHPSQKAIEHGHAGISFAMRKEMITEQDIKFFSSPDEDYRLMWEVFSKGKKPIIANCVGYFVHGLEWNPKEHLCNVNGESTCEFVNAEVMEFQNTD